MNKIVKYSAMLLCTLSLASCMENFLNRYPSRPTTGDFYQVGEETVKLALTGVYNGLYHNSAGTDIAHGLPGFITYDVFSGLVVPREENITIGSGDISTSNTDIRHYWKSWYVIISRANTILDNTYDSPSAKLKQYLAEARVLRATAYYYLIAMFGDVPFFIESLDFDEFKTMGRTSKVDILDFIISELEAAAGDLPGWIASERGRMDKAAAYGILSRAALMGAGFNYGNKAAHYFGVAADAAEKVIGNRQLAANFAELFTKTGQAKSDVRSEMIMEICYEKTTGAQFNLAGFTEGSRFYAQSSRYPTQTLFDTYECIDGLRIDQSPLYDPHNPKKNRDPRLHNTILITGDTVTANTGGDYRTKVVLNVYRYNTPDAGDYQKTMKFDYATKKWEKVSNMDFTDAAAIQSSFIARGKGYMSGKFSRDSIDIINTQTLNIPIMRYSEVLLNYAEAKIELGELDESVYDAISQVRTRSGMPEVSEDRKGDIDKMRQLVRRERKVELALEGHLMFDIRRWDIGGLINSQPVYGMPMEYLDADDNGAYDEGVDTYIGGFSSTDVQPPVFGTPGSDMDMNDIATYPDKDIRLVRDQNRRWLPEFRLWPIPQSEIDYMGLEQNPGY